MTNPSRKIVEAAGDCWHEHPIQETSNNISDDHTFVECVKCGEDFVALELAPNLYPDLTDEKNRGLLIGYVKRICGDDVVKWKVFTKSLLGVEQIAGMFNALRIVQVCFRASAESICKALVEVIENEATVQ